MATFGQIPSNINFSKMNVVADIAARDALTGMVQGDVCFVNGVGDNGLSYFYNGTSWVPHSGQLIEKITLGATGTISFTNIVSGFSKLVVRWSVRGVRAAANSDTLMFYIDGDTITTNYHRQFSAASDDIAVLSENTLPTIGVVPAASAPANSFGTGEAHLINYGETSRVKHVYATYVSLRDTDNIHTGAVGMAHDAGPADTIDTSLVLDGFNDALASGSWAELWGY